MPVVTYNYHYQGDLTAQVEAARALTPEVVRPPPGRRLRPRSLVAERISRLSLISFEHPPSDSEQSYSAPPPPAPHSNSLPSILPNRLAAPITSGPSSPRSTRHRLRAAQNQTRSAPSTWSSTPPAPPSNMSRGGMTPTRPSNINMPSSNAVASSSRHASSPASPRSSFLPSFMRTRSRAATLTLRTGSPTTEAPNPLGNSNSRNQQARESSNGQSNARAERDPPEPVYAKNPNPYTGTVEQHRCRLVPYLENQRSLAFEPVVRQFMAISVPVETSPHAVAAALGEIPPDAGRELPPLTVLKVGRFVDRTPQPPPEEGAIAIAGGGGGQYAENVTFKSKVVSRNHADMWCEPGGKFYIRDAASSSGTFVNQSRLSGPNRRSTPTLLTDGDIIQLGVDFQGGEDRLFRCIKMRVEINRDWQHGANEFNTNALRQLKALGGGVVTPDAKGKSVETPSSRQRKTSVTDCCICLFSVTVCQALFIAPCSHVFHYKCIRPLLDKHHPGFSCPLCRSFANLEADVETEDAFELASRRASILSRKVSNHSLRLPPASEMPGSPSAPPRTENRPSTSIAIGGSSASISELFASHADDEAANREPVNLTESVSTVDDRPAVNGSAEPTLPPALGVPLAEDAFGASSEGGAGGGGIPDIQTPMNDSILATPGVHQRLDLADRMEGLHHDDIFDEEVDPMDPRAGGSRGSSGGSRASAEGSREGWTEVEREERRDTDPFFV